MPNDYEHIEATVWGQSVSIAMSSLMPLLLIILLGINTWVTIRTNHLMTKATDDAAQYIIKDAHEIIERQQAELRAENTNRSHEHDDILKLINTSIDQQNRMFLASVNEQNSMFLQAIARKAADDTKQHAAVERAVIRSCRATEKAFASTDHRLRLLGQSAHALEVNAAYISHLYQ